jgi:hypothetical protein
VSVARLFLSLLAKYWWLILLILILIWMFGGKKR